MLGRTQFVGSEFGILGGFGWVRSSVLVGEPGFGWVRSSDLKFANPGDLIILSFFSKMFIVVGFVGSEFGIFGGFGWVRSSVLVGEPGFGRVRSSTSRVRSSSKFVIFGFDPTLVHASPKVLLLVVLLNVPLSTKMLKCAVPIYCYVMAH